MNCTTIIVTVILTVGATLLALKLVRQNRQDELDFWDIQQDASRRLSQHTHTGQTRRDQAKDRGADIQWHQEKKNG